MTCRALAIAVLGSACISSSPPPLQQRGVGPRPRMAPWDGQPLAKQRSVGFYGELGATPTTNNVAHTQAGAEARFRQGPSWDTSIQIDVATGLLKTQKNEVVVPPFGPAVGVGGAIRKSLGSAAFRVGLFASAQLWRVPIRSEVRGETQTENAGPIRPTVSAGLVLGWRVGERGSIYFGLAPLAAIHIPEQREVEESPKADVVPGFTTQLGVRVPVSDNAALQIGAAASIHTQEEGWLGGHAGVVIDFE